MSFLRCQTREHNHKIDEGGLKPRKLQELQIKPYFYSTFWATSTICQNKIKILNTILIEEDRRAVTVQHISDPNSQCFSRYFKHRFKLRNIKCIACFFSECSSLAFLVYCAPLFFHWFYLFSQLQIILVIHIVSDWCCILQLWTAWRKCPRGCGSAFTS